MHPVNHIEQCETEREEVPGKLGLSIFCHFCDGPGTAVNPGDRIKRPPSQQGCSFSFLPESESVSTNSSLDGKQSLMDPLEGPSSICGQKFLI